MSSGTLKVCSLTRSLYVVHFLLVAVLLYLRPKCWQYCILLVCAVHANCCVNTKPWFIWELLWQSVCRHIAGQIQHAMYICWNLGYDLQSILGRTNPDVGKS